ncbi:putative sensor histidine kinase response regulator [Magnetofaba australis IT-1]|uniref:Sensory/regulatory protein RpfC n=1 Tax=Magnetofaba australis IT-1 TaxID=1434232 RepID=A0A1Y2K6Y5_9PROT|nr:putative sensor histidine kinase response regulator [Magnetofaba australis IT-1]
MNSYHPGYFWSDNITTGIRELLDERSDVELFVEYMDTKRHANPAHMARLAELYIAKYRHLNIDYVITSDDNAFDFFKAYRAQIAPDAPWVFCGLDNVQPTRIAGLENVYGVEENLGVEDTLKLAMRLHPDLKEVFFISDATKSGLSYAEKAHRLEQKYKHKLRFFHLNILSIEELKTALANMPENAVVIYMSFIRDRNGEVLTLKESHTLAATHAALPVYVTWGFRPGLGIVGGAVTSGQTQGERAAKIVEALLNGVNADAIPKLQKAPHVTQLDSQALKRFNISIKNLPKPHQLYNQPHSPMHQFPLQSALVLLIITLLLIAVGFLIVYVRRLSAARNKLLESERYNRMLFEHSPTGLALCRMNGELVDVNPAYGKIIGQSVEEAKSLSYWEITPQEYAEQEAEQLKALERTGQYGPYEKEYLHKSGERIPVSLSGRLVELGGEKFIWSSVEDTSLRRQAETLRLQYQQQLELKVQERTRELVRAKEAAQRADQAKSEFLAVMSHEVRTPINTILGMGELLAESKLNEAQREDLNILRLASENLLSLINNVLDLSKIEAKQLALEEAPTNLQETIEDVIQMFAPQSASKGVALTSRIAPQLTQPVLIDVQRLKQVLINLTGNAIKFTDHGEVTITASTPNPEQLLLEVADSGIGISSDHLDSIFQPFQQCDGSVTRRYGGTGLGLTICRQLLHAMDGSIEARSELGKGSSFLCTLPLRPAPISLAPPSSEPSPSSTRTHALGAPKRILLVDDAPDNLRLAHAFLHSDAYETSEAFNGAEALERFTHERFDLVVMDIQMPVMDGVTATREIRRWEARNRPGQPPTPIIALTAHAMREDAERSQKAGCNMHLTKPVRKARLLEVVEQFLYPQPLAKES